MYLLPAAGSGAGHGQIVHDRVVVAITHEALLNPHVRVVLLPAAG
jgi:hypothetical protein